MSTCVYWNLVGRNTKTKGSTVTQWQPQLVLITGDGKISEKEFLVFCWKVLHYEFGDLTQVGVNIFSLVYSFMLGKESPTTEDEGGMVIIVLNTVIVATVVLYVGDSHAYSWGPKEREHCLGNVIRLHLSERRAKEVPSGFYYEKRGLENRSQRTRWNVNGQAGRRCNRRLSNVCRK